MSMLELLSGPENWTRWVEFADSNGNRVPREEACKYCLMGALQAAGRHGFWDLRYVADWIRKHYQISPRDAEDDIATIVAFNDDIAEWKDIQRMLSDLFGHRPRSKG